MKAHNAIHWLAVLLLVVLMVMSLQGLMSSIVGTPIQRIVSGAFAVTIWSLLIFKIWKNPRKSGLAIGVFLFAILAFQIYLWRLAICGPNPGTLGVFANPFAFALHEVPLVVAAVCCILLRWRYPDEANRISK